jgi:hypothetical protein
MEKIGKMGGGSVKATLLLITGRINVWAVIGPCAMSLELTKCPYEIKSASWSQDINYFY